MSQAQSIWIINGPNLNLLGYREPEIYGKHTLIDIEQECLKIADKHLVSIDFRQSNHEGDLIDWVQEAGKITQGLIINAAGLTHTSISLYDALKAISIPKIEVHLSNIYSRESFRQKSLISPAVNGIVAGLGRKGYIIALEALITQYLKPEIG
jgi:3-dehydroquinate dehydratase-2